MKYIYDKKENKIIFSKPIKKGNNNIKVFFTRLIDERKATDLPVATTNGNGTEEYNVYDLQPFIIYTVHIRQPKLFGLLQGKWEIVEEDK